MTGFLVRHLVKDWEKTEDPAVRERYGVLSGAVGILLNLSLIHISLPGRLWPRPPDGAFLRLAPDGSLW